MSQINPQCGHEGCHFDGSPYDDGCLQTEQVKCATCDRMTTPICGGCWVRSDDPQPPGRDYWKQRCEAAEDQVAEWESRAARSSSVSRDAVGHLIIERVIRYPIPTVGDCWAMADSIIALLNGETK